MNLKTLILYSLASTALLGCAGFNEREKAELSLKFSELRASLDETNSRLQELNNKFSLLHEKMESARAGYERSEAVPAGPPEGLKVVNLEEARAGEEPAKRGEKREEASQAVRVRFDKAEKTEAQPQPLQAAPQAGPEALYGKGQDLFMAGKYKDARAVFLSFVKTYPKHSLADNALYWVGESYYTEKDFEKALSHFRETAERYPDENKAPDALLKAAYSYMELHNGEKARKALEGLVKKYPESEAADRAKTTLERLSGVKEGMR